METKSGKIANSNSSVSLPDKKMDMPLTSEQRLKIEENRRKALERKRKAEENAKNKGQKQKNDPKLSNKVIDTGGGFLLTEEDLKEENQKKMRIVEKPEPILPPDQPPCLECNKKFGGSYLLEKFDYTVCDNCRDEVKHSLITKTEAKKNYLLTDVDLEKRGEPLKFILGKNPHNSRWSDMKLYLLIQVEQRALEVWGSEEKLLEELENREEKRQTTKQKSYQKKMKELKMSVRSSVYARSLSDVHEHQFGEETYDSAEDSYSRTCSTCDFKETYEKM